MTARYRAEAQSQWDKARTKATWATLRARLQGKSSELIDFNDVAQRLHLKTAIYLGAQIVPIKQIVGSVGRYKDFTNTFLPKSNSMNGRWADVAMLQLNPHSEGVPPVSLWKLGEWYFVQDGNHRISVARQIGLEDIEAFVWEYPEPPIELSPDMDVDSALLEWERADFLEKTKLNQLRPNNDFHVTVPGSYHYAMCQISHYQTILSKIDGEPVSYVEAVTGWYDMVYEVLKQTILELGVMSEFPTRTPADFFIWITEYREALEREYQERVRITQAIRQYRKERGVLGRWLTRIKHKLRKI